MNFFFTSCISFFIYIKQDWSADTYINKKEEKFVFLLNLLMHSISIYFYIYVLYLFIYLYIYK